MLLCKRKKASALKKFTLSDNAIIFIKQFALSELGISLPINADKLDKIVDLATQWEEDMIDPISRDGCDKTYDYPEKRRNELADKFVGEITGQWDDDKLVPDFDDLNKRLGLM